MGTRLLPSSDRDKDKNFSGTLCRTRTEIMINLATLCLEMFNFAYLSLPAQILLFKPKGHVFTPNMD
jgi:hypothetical protein